MKLLLFFFQVQWRQRHQVLLLLYFQDSRIVLAWTRDYGCFTDGKLLLFRLWNILVAAQWFFARCFVGVY